MNITECLNQFEGVRKSGAGWIAQCPGPNHKHGDRTPSLSVKEGDDGRILLNCHAKCDAKQICDAKGWKLSDLFPENGNGNDRPHSPPNQKAATPRAKTNSKPSSLPSGSAPREVCAYDYVNERGELLYQNVRLDPKDFRMRRKDGQAWMYNLAGVRRVPYHLPQIIAANFVLIVEGEKDADTAAKLGLAATSSKHWCPEFSEFLRGKRVAIIADADDAGRKIASDIAQELTGKTASLKVLELPGSKDLSDWVAAGGNRNALIGFIETQKECELWREIFHSFNDFENAAPLTFAIKGFLQNNGATLIGGLSGHGKTFILLSEVKALFAGEGTMLWNYFEVLETASRILYLIPESAIEPFKHRLKRFGLYDYLRDDRLLVRTLSKGPTPCLSDPRILFAAKGAHVFLDTAVRFSTEGDENSAGDNQRGLASDIFALLGAGARTVSGAHHSPKPFARENVMRLETVLRGSGDIGAMLTTAWGIKQLDAAENIIHVENIKPRDFQPCQPFQIIGRPFIDETGDFALHKKPGECGSLMDEQMPDRDKGGAPEPVREARAANIALLRQWLCDAPSLTSKELSHKFANIGISLGDSAIRKYRKEIGL